MMWFTLRLLQRALRATATSAVPAGRFMAGPTPCVFTSALSFDPSKAMHTEKETRHLRRKTNKKQQLP